MPCHRDVFVEFGVKTAIIQRITPCCRDVSVEFWAKTAIIQQLVPCHRDVFVEFGVQLQVEYAYLLIGKIVHEPEAFVRVTDDAVIPAGLIEDLH